MYNYYCLNPISNKGLSRFGEDYKKSDEIENAIAILVRSASMKDMEFSNGLLAIARAGAGVNNIPVEECAKQGIVVFNTPGANANGVKELVLCAMVMAARNLDGAVNWVSENKLNPDVAKIAEKAKGAFAGTEISGKKLGVIGLGAIGGGVANAAFKLGMEVYGYDPYLSVEAAINLNNNVKHVKNVDEIYEQCDFITVHVGLNDATKGSINRAAMDKMKDGVILLNFARDLIVDEEALLESLESGKIRKYATDFPNETVAKAKNCIIIPHLGASTEESEDNCAVMAVRQLKEYIENGNIINSVNLPNCDMGVCQTAGRVVIINKNTANMITKYTGVLGDNNINIADMSNKSRGDYAYTMIDTDSAITDDLVKKLSDIQGVIKVRKIR